MSTILWFLLLFVVVIVIIRIATKKRGQSARSSSDRAPEVDVTNLEIQQAAVGDVLVLAGATEDFEDLSFTVDRRYRYEVDGFSWYELSGKHRGKRINLEWSEDDELEVFLNVHKGIKLSKLGIKESELKRMHQQQSGDNQVQFDGKKWHYESSHQVQFFEDERASGEPFMVWDFAEEDGELRLYVEKWEGEPYEGGISKRIEPSTISVYRR